MAETVVFCVQPYVRRGGVLAAGDLRQYAGAIEAEEAAKLMAPHVAGVIMYGLAGQPEFDCWGEPELFLSLGETPPTDCYEAA